MNNPRIDFYVLSECKENGRMLLACRLTDKAYQLGHSVYIATASEAQAAILDDLLWTFRQDSFIPHERYSAAHPQESPVLIGIGADVAPHRNLQILINLTDVIPNGLEHYQRVIEVVDTDPQVLAASRQRFREYREHGLTQETHKL